MGETLYRRPEILFRWGDFGSIQSLRGEISYQSKGDSVSGETLFRDTGGLDLLLWLLSIPREVVGAKILKVACNGFVEIVWCSQVWCSWRVHLIVSYISKTYFKTITLRTVDLYCSQRTAYPRNYGNKRTASNNWKVVFIRSGKERVLGVGLPGSNEGGIFYENNIEEKWICYDAIFVLYCWQVDKPQRFYM